MPCPMKVLPAILLVIMTLVIGVLLGSLLGKTNIVTKKTVLTDENLIEFVENYNYILKIKGLDELTKVRP